MSSLDLSDEKDGLPGAALKPKKNGKKYWIVLSAAVVLVLAACAFGIKYYFDSQVVGGIPTWAPIASFGLCPENAQNAELISETVIATKQAVKEKFSGDYTYDINMEYKIKTDKDLEFSIPFALPPPSPDALDPMEISVDGKSVSYQTEYIPYAYSTRPFSDKIIEQSIRIYPLLANSKTQPVNTYDLLINGYGKTLHSFNQDSKFLIYDLSSGGKDCTLEITGNLNQLRLVFQNQEAKLNHTSNYEMKDMDESNNTGTVKYIIPSTSSGHMALGVPENSGEMAVKWNGKEIKPAVMKLKDIIEKYAVTDDINDYIEKLNLYTGPIKPDGQLYFVDNRALYHTGNTSSNTGGVQKYTFSVQKGEHVITIKQQTLGDAAGNNYHSFQWIDSPSSFWKTTGERSLTIDAGGDKSIYVIGDGIIDFIKKKS